MWDDIIVKDSQWAYPTAKSFKEKIRMVYKQHGIYKKWAMALKKNIRKTHAKARIFDLMYEALDIPSASQPFEREGQLITEIN